MRKIQDRSNNFAEMGRLKKAIALAAVIRQNYNPITQDVLDALPTQENDWWVSLSKAAKVNPPSPATVEAVVGLLSQEVGAYSHPDDALEGLPTP